MFDKVIDRLRGRAPPDSGPAPKKSPAGRLYASITVVPGRTCCHAARKLRKARTLVDQAPRLPLPDCTQPEACECTFEKYADRRSKADGDRRVVGLWQPGLWKQGGERRVKKGRRFVDR